MTAVWMLWACLLILAIWGVFQSRKLTEVDRRQDAVTTAAMNAEGSALAARRWAAKSAEHAEAAAGAWAGVATRNIMDNDRRLDAVEARLTAIENDKAAIRPS